jgi:hypothetical protein
MEMSAALKLAQRFFFAAMVNPALANAPKNLNFLKQSCA